MTERKRSEPKDTTAAESAALRRVSEKWSDLTGKYFHVFTWDEKEQRRVIEGQGVIYADLGGGYYMVQYFEWLTGSPGWYGTKVKHINEIASEGWCFYSTAAAMNEAYEYGGGARRGRND